MTVRHHPRVAARTGPIPRFLLRLLGCLIAAMFAAWIATVLTFGHAIPAIVADALADGVIGVGALAALVMLTCAGEKQP